MKSNTDQKKAKSRRQKCCVDSPSVKRPLLIDTPSFRHSPVASVFPTFSLPARSTKCNFDVIIVVDAPLEGENML